MGFIVHAHDARSLVTRWNLKAFLTQVYVCQIQHIRRRERKLERHWHLPWGTLACKELLVLDALTGMLPDLVLDVPYDPKDFP